MREPSKFVLAACLIQQEVEMNRLSSSLALHIDVYLSTSSKIALSSTSLQSPLHLTARYKSDCGQRVFAGSIHVHETPVEEAACFSAFSRPIK